VKGRDNLKDLDVGGRSITRMRESGRMRWVRYVAHGGKRIACRILVRKRERKGLLERPRRRWKEYN
jgi:hypothetical protein